MRKINHYHILLVDDEYYLRQSIRRIMQQMDTEFRVTAEAGNGEEALAILKEKDIQMVITDIRMPVMDGLKLSKQIHEQYPDIVVIILTGYADFEYAQTALRYGAFDYLLKPVSAEDLETALSHARLQLQKSFELPEDVSGDSRSASETVDFAIKYMQEHYMEEIDIGLMAEKLGFQSAYLARLFNRYAGESPLKYLTNIRIHEAKRLLMDPSLSIAKVGEMVGYPDQFHFSKTFRKATGMNPSAFRRQGEEES